jgi:hypothetical protein
MEPLADKQKVSSVVRVLPMNEQFGGSSICKSPHMSFVSPVLLN